MVQLSKRTMHNITQNVSIALGLKAVFLVTTIVGITGLWPAILADTGATVLVTANAMRLLGWRERYRSRLYEGSGPLPRPLQDPRHGDGIRSKSNVNDPELHKRLRRAEGHLKTVVPMVADGKDGLAIAQQMQAVISALEKAKQLLIVDHIDHHLAEDGGALPPELREKLAALCDSTGVRGFVPNASRLEAVQAP